MNAKPALILASQSPRRLKLLRQAGYAPEARPARIAEVRRPGEDPIPYVLRLAAEKAAAVEGELVLAADTVVDLDGEALEKPADSSDATRMLRALAGRRHQVHTGIAIRWRGDLVIDHATTQVWFLPLGPGEIDAYVATNEPMDKAGAYAIQGRASRFVERIEGCYFNVVGLPVSLVARHFRKMGVDPVGE
jgi:septum formation protein